MRHAALIACAALAGWCAPAARASVLYASSNTPGGGSPESIWTIHQDTGAATLLGSSGFDSPIDLTSDWRPGSFRLWACNSLSNQLVSIDPATGIGTAIGSFGTANAMQSLAYNTVNDKLYGVTDFDELYEINPLSGSSVYIGDIDVYFGILALAFDGAGTLYGVSDETSQLVTIKTDTAVASAIAPVGVLHVADLAMRPEDGVMFAVSTETDQIYTLNTSNGALTAVGPHGQGVDHMVGLAFGPIPEPASLSLFGLGALALLRRRR